MSLFLQLLELQKQLNNIDANVTATTRDWYCATVSILVKSAAHECHHKNPWGNTVPGLLQGFTWDDTVTVQTRDRCVNRAESLTVVGLQWRARKFFIFTTASSAIHSFLIDQSKSSLPNDLFLPSGFPTKMSCSFVISTMSALCSLEDRDVSQG